MHATMATFLGLPAAIKRLWKSLQIRFGTSTAKQIAAQGLWARGQFKRVIELPTSPELLTTTIKEIETRHKNLKSKDTRQQVSSGNNSDESMRRRTT